MGQPISVTEKPTATRGIVRFEINRSLTGMGHVRYKTGVPVTGDRPTDELARRLLATGQVAALHVYANQITIDLAKGATDEGLREIIENLFIYYRPGVQPTPV